MGADNHADEVLATLALGDQAAPAQIVASWKRCVQEYGLEPHKVAYPTIVSSGELKDVRAPIDDLIALASPEVERLFGRLSDHGYIVSLTDGNGVTVMFRSPMPLVSRCTQSGVLLGAVWSEQSQGTNGIGTCIRERKPISVVMEDHFGSKLVGLSCTVAPIFGAGGSLVATINVTTPNLSEHATQALVRDIVKQSARRIENRYFSRRHAGRSVLRISRHDDFSDSAVEVRVAVDASGRVVDATSDAARSLFARDLASVWPSADAGGFDVRAITNRAQQAGPGVSVATTEPGGRRLFVRVAAQSARSPGTPPLPASTPSPSRRQAPAATSAPDVASILGDDTVFAQRGRLAQRLIDRRLPILLQGETGTGKSLLARALHKESPHAGGPFVAINCAAIPRELIESELFGHRPGAFTGATRHGARGRIIEADGGTLFLDEIGDMPLALQTRLLHVLSDGEFVPVGATEPVKVVFALVSASLHDIADLVRQRLFRNDLYFRLNGVTVTLSPLRERADRAALTQRIFQEEAADAGFGPVVLDAEVRRCLATHDWPGNLRELRHVARYAVTLADEPVISMSCLPPPLNVSAGEGGGEEERTRRRVEQALVAADWNVSTAALHLGLSRATVHRRIVALGLKRPGMSRPAD